MKLRKILLDEHYRLYWKQGPILPDPYPPDHPRAPCYRCNQLCQGVANWLEGLFRFLLIPNRRHRTRCLILIGLLTFMITVLNRGQHPMTLNHSIHSPTAHNSWRGFLLGLLGGSSTEHRPGRRQLVQDWVFAPNCDALLRGDEEEIHFTKRMLYREVRDKVTDNEYYENTKSCAEFRANEGYPAVPLSSEEANFPVAYMIQSYKNAEQLHRLLKSIYAPQNPYCICSNHKANLEFDKSVRSIANCFHNVYHISTLKMNRTKSHHLSEMDDIRCAQKCIKVLLNADWKYLIKIHGQDYPLVTTQYIVTKLRNLERLKIPFISDYSHMHRKQSVKVVTSDENSNKTETTELSLWRGSPYFISSKTIVQQVMDSILLNKLLPLIDHHEHPEAYYWVTLFLYMMGDANHAAIVAANMHRIELLTQKNLHTKQYCAGVTQLLDPCILGVDDLSKLFHAHQHQFFAHGFDLDHDHIAYNCLEQRIADAVAEYGGNLTMKFNDPKLHAEHPEIELIVKDKSPDKTANPNFDPNTALAQERVRSKASDNIRNTILSNEYKMLTNKDTVTKKITKQDDVKKTLTEAENDEAAKKRHAKLSLENKVTAHENVSESTRRDQMRSSNATRLLEEKKGPRHVKEAEYYNKQDHSSLLHDTKQPERRNVESDQLTLERGIRSGKSTTKDEEALKKVTAMFFPVTELSDYTSASPKDLVELLKTGHLNKRRHEPGKLELDMLELDRSSQYQAHAKGKGSIQLMYENKDGYIKPNTETVLGEHHESFSIDTVASIGAKHDTGKETSNLIFNIKDKNALKDETATDDSSKPTDKDMKTLEIDR